MLRQVEKEINGNRYEMIKFGAKESLKLATRLAKSIKGDGENVFEGGIQAVAVSIVANDEFTSMVEHLTKNVTHNGLSINFDDHFAEHPKDLLPVLGWSLKENIAGFFDTTALVTLAETALADLQ